MQEEEHWERGAGTNGNWVSEVNNRIQQGVTEGEGAK